MITTNAPVVAAEFFASSAKVSSRAAKVTRTYAEILAQRVKLKASGRPGPRVITGRYRASIHVQEGLSREGVSTFLVGTDDPRGARLEFGFHGADSRGRNYDQPPFPHFGPATDEIEPLYVAALGVTVDIL